MFNWQATDYRLLLKNELTERLGSNSSYSQGAFARDVDLAPSRLSELFSGKQGLSRKKAESICDNLGFDGKQTEFFTCLVEKDHARSKTQKKIAELKLKKFQKNSTTPLEQEYYSLIAEWYHFPILELIQIEGFQNDQFYCQPSKLEE